MLRGRFSLRIVLLSLLIGLATSVCIAWLCAWLSPLEGVQNVPRFSHQANPRWILRLREGLGVTQVSSVIDHEQERIVDAADCRNVPWSRTKQPPPEGAQWNALPQMVESATGWPWRAMMWDADWVYPRGATAPTVLSVRGGIVLPGGIAASPLIHVVRNVLPLKIIWRGMILNALVFGAAWWLVTAAFATRRCLLRAMIGHCPSCGYDLRGTHLGQCSECGSRIGPGSLRFEWWFSRTMRLAFAVALGAGTTIAVAWLIAWTTRFTDAPARVAWASPIPSEWLYVRIDALGATRAAKVHDGSLAESGQRHERERERAHQDQLPEAMTLKDLEEEHAAQIRGIVLTQQYIPDVDSDLLPTWVRESGVERDVLSPVIVHKPVIARDAYGWPLPAMWLNLSCSSSMGNVALLGVRRILVKGTHNGLPIDLPGSDAFLTARALPLGILWPGFAINALAFGVIWLVLLSVVAFARDRRALRKAKESLASQP